jgi:hypothetical protein
MHNATYEAECRKRIACFAHVVVYTKDLVLSEILRYGVG